MEPSAPGSGTLTGGSVKNKILERGGPPTASNDTHYAVMYNLNLKY